MAHQPDPRPGDPPEARPYPGPASERPFAEGPFDGNGATDPATTGPAGPSNALEEPRAQREPAPERRRRRSRLFPAVLGLAGGVVLVVAVVMGQPLSIGSVLGVLMLASAAIRFEIARRI